MADDGTPPFDEGTRAIGYPLSQMGWDLYEQFFLSLPPYDPDDITTWDAQQLDELAVWDAAVNGYELTWDPPDPVCPGHATTLPGEFTTLTDWPAGGPDIRYGD